MKWTKPKEMSIVINVHTGKKNMTLETQWARKLKKTREINKSISRKKFF